MSTERVIVQRSIAEKFRERLTAVTENIHGANTAATVLVTPAAVDKTHVLLSDAVAKGASTVFGDATATAPTPTSLRPVIVENITKDMDLYAKESFGPTVSLFVVDTEEEAITLANDTEYGLVASVFTEDLRRGLRVARQIESG
jgi:acyl-CoA reductase-like NAD-dependent aldehyde dehydrogenase